MARIVPDANAMTLHQRCSSSQMNLEGIVSKRRDTPYRSDRRDAWLKSVCRRRATFIVAGFALNKCTPRSGGMIR